MVKWEMTSWVSHVCGSAGGWGWFRVVRATVGIDADLAPFPHFSQKGLVAQPSPYLPFWSNSVLSLK